jgi:tRNA nucleotidyltransferase (CCA-adding enzyme)
MRLACELGFRLEATTAAWIRQHHHQLQTVAGERILAELERLAAAPDGGEGLAQTVASGLLQGWRGGKAPQDAAGQPGDGGLLASLDRLTPGEAAARGLSPAETERALPLARLAAVLDGEGLERLHASRRRQQAVERLRQWWERLGAVGGDPELLPETERVLLQRQLEADLPALALLLDAAWARSARPRWRDPADPLFHPRPPIDGTALQSQLNLKPGRELGQLLEHLTRERAFGRLPVQAASNDAETLTMARNWLSSRAVPRHG